MINQPLPNLQSTQRFTFSTDGYAATVEMKLYGEESQSLWWISGPNKNGWPVLLAQLSIALPNLGREGLETVFETHILPLMKLSQADDGIIARMFDRTQSEIEQVLDPHFAIHTNSMSVAGDTVVAHTAVAYRLVDSFGLQKVIDYLARKEGGQVNTLKKRVGLAREAGLLARKRESKTGRY